MSEPASYTVTFNRLPDDFKVIAGRKGKGAIVLRTTDEANFHNDIDEVYRCLIAASLLKIDNISVNKMDYNDVIHLLDLQRTRILGGSFDIKFKEVQ